MYKDNTFPAGTETVVDIVSCLDSIFLASKLDVVAMLTEAVTVEEAISGTPAVNETETPTSTVTDKPHVDSVSVVYVICLCTTKSGPELTATDIKRINKNYIDNHKKRIVSLPQLLAEVRAEIGVGLADKIFWLAKS